MSLVNVKVSERNWENFGVQPRVASNPACAAMADPEIWNYTPVLGSSEYLRLRTRALRYRSLVPSMLYATTCCRSETAFAISKLCMHLDNPSECHLNAADQTLSYLVNTPDLGVTFYPDGSSRDINLTGYYSTWRSLGSRRTQATRGGAAGFSAGTAARHRTTHSAQGSGPTSSATRPITAASPRPRI